MRAVAILARSDSPADQSTLRDLPRDDLASLLEVLSERLYAHTSSVSASVDAGLQGER